MNEEEVKAAMRQAFARSADDKEWQPEVKTEYAVRWDDDQLEVQRSWWYAESRKQGLEKHPSARDVRIVKRYVVSTPWEDGSRRPS